jgi:hypothetical protein
MQPKILFAAMAMAYAVLGAASAAQAQSCSFPHGAETSVDELIAIVDAEPNCGLPWSIVTRVAADPVNAERLRAEYRAIIARRPDLARGVRELALMVDAAAGHPEALLAFYDGNVVAHPEDKSLSNTSCWIRGETGIDLTHAMPFCDAAVAAGRPAYSLLNRGIVNLLLKQDSAALSDFNEAISQPGFRKHPFYPAALYGRGYARLRTGDLQGATDVRKSLELRPSVAADFAAAGFRP